MVTAVSFQKTSSEVQRLLYRGFFGLGLVSDLGSELNDSRCVHFHECAHHMQTLVVFIKLLASFSLGEGGTCTLDCVETHAT